MSKLKNSVKDLFDLRKPVTTIGKKLTLVGIIFLLDVLFNILIGAIKGLEFYYSVIFSRYFLKEIIVVPIREGLTFWWLLWLLALMLLWLNSDLKLIKFINRKINLAWFLIMLCGIKFYLVHLPNRYINYSTSALIGIGIAGIVYGWLIIKTRSIWPNILCHALWNFSLMIFFC